MSFESRTEREVRVILDGGRKGVPGCVIFKEVLFRYR